MKAEIYCWPVNEKDIEGFSPFESPTHKGIETLVNACDFIVPVDTKILAMSKGEVTYIKQDSKRGGNDFPECGDVNNSKYWKDGNRIEIRHDKNIYSAYEHLGFNTSLVTKGQIVEKGQPIALTGYTGFMAHLGPHLHVERLIWTGDDDEDYLCLPLHFENELLLFTKYLWDSKKWKEVRNFQNVEYGKNNNKSG